MPPKREENLWQAVGRYSAMALLLPLATFIGYAIGYLLDKAFGTRFLYLVFIFLGFAAGIIELLRELTPKDGS